MHAAAAAAAAAAASLFQPASDVSCEPSSLRKEKKVAVGYHRPLLW